MSRNHTFFAVLQGDHHTQTRLFQHCRPQARFASTSSCLHSPMSTAAPRKRRRDALVECGDELSSLCDEAYDALVAAEQADVSEGRLQFVSPVSSPARAMTLSARSRTASLTDAPASALPIEPECMCSLPRVVTTAHRPSCPSHAHLVRRGAVLPDPSHVNLICLAHSPLVIGRAIAIVDVALDSPRLTSFISRTHATMRQVEGVWQVQDLGSTNGLALNDVRVAPHEWVTLAAGQTVTFGGVGAKPVGAHVPQPNSEFCYEFVRAAAGASASARILSLDGCAVEGPAAKRARKTEPEPELAPDAKAEALAAETRKLAEQAAQHAREYEQRISELQRTSEHALAELEEERRAREARERQASMDVSEANAQLERMVARMQELEKAQAVRGESAVPIARLEDEICCVICLEVPALAVVAAPCGHIFCASCLDDWLATDPRKSCPSDRNTVTHHTRSTIVDGLVSLIVDKRSPADKAEFAARKARKEAEDHALAQLRKSVQSAMQAGKQGSFLNIANCWSPADRDKFARGLAPYERGPARAYYCELTRLKADWVAAASMAALRTACANIGLAPPCNETAAREALFAFIRSKVR